MKPKLSLGWSLVICIVLVAFGLVYGNTSGYGDERARATALYQGDGGVLEVLNYRARDGLNLCVVANRHLTGNADVETLKSAAEALLAPPKSPRAAFEGNRALTQAFAAVSAGLKTSAGWGTVGRDTQYLQMIEADFEAYAQSGVYAAYNAAAQAFNAKLAAPVMGDAARFFGVKPCELYQ